MKKDNALRIVFFVALFGLLFSGVLSYQELFVSKAFTCPSIGAPGTILGYPACVYGFLMYLLITVISGAGLIKK